MNLHFLSALRTLCNISSWRREIMDLVCRSEDERLYFVIPATDVHSTPAATAVGPDQKLFWVIYPKVEWIKVDALMRYKVKLFFLGNLLFDMFYLIHSTVLPFIHFGFWQKNLLIIRNVKIFLFIQIFQRIAHKYASSPDRQLLLEKQNWKSISHFWNLLSS